MKPKNKIKIGTVTKDDVEWQFFRAGGKGGQAQNKHDSGARCIHRPSGARGESREARGQLENRRIAFRRMAESDEFKRWVRIQAGLDLTIEAKVEQMMEPSNLKAEVFRDGKWVEVDIKDLE
jgi:hypothetical protein